MPRRTRRSDEPSAAVQSEEALADSAAANESADQTVTSDNVPTTSRARTPRRRTEQKPVEVVASAETEQAGEELAPSAETSQRRRIRRPPRSSKSSAAATEVTAIAEAEQDPIVEAALTPPDETSSSPAEETSSIRRPPPNRRRVGGRRTVTEARNAAEEVPATVPTPSTTEASTTPSSRSRRRRGGKKNDQAAPTSADTELTDVLVGEAVLLEVSEAVDASSEDVSATDEEKKRSRRSRRGGRRRSGRSSDSENADESEGETTDGEEAELEISTLSTPAPPWKAPMLVPTPEFLGLSKSELSTSAVLSDDLSGFVINGEFYAPELFFVNSETAEDPEVVSSQITLAAGAGVHLHSGVAYLPLKNAFGVRSFASVQSLVKQVLDADPDGYIFVRLQCVPTNFWARTHPGEMAVYSDGTSGDVSFASIEFWQDTVDAVAALIQFVADPANEGANRIIGFHLDKGEWFNDANAGYDYSGPNRMAFQHWLHETYQNHYALRAAWFSGTVQFETAEIPKWHGSPAGRKKEEVVLYTRPKEKRYVDYNAFTSDLMAQAITGVAQAIKWLSDGKLLVGASYGYTYEFATRNDSGHQALHRVLKSSFVDIVAGPNSYATRQAGGAGSFSSPIDSARLNRKLWIVEDDTKTYLAADETEDSFNPKVPTNQDTISVLRRNASAAFVHGCGICWMDLWGNGWLNSPEIWAEIALLKSQGAIARLQKNAVEHVPEVAVLVDEAGYNYVCGDPSGVALQSDLITKSRELIYRSGASVGFYLQSDVSRLPEGIKLYIFLNPLRVTSEERRAIREKLQKPGKTLAFLYAPGLFDERGDSPAEVSEIVGMPLKALPWNSHIGTIFTEERHPVIERLHGGKRLGSDEVLNPSYGVVDPAAIVLGEYAQSGAISIAAKINEGGWKSVFIGEPHLTGELLRGLYRFSGIHVYDMQDDIAHCSANGLLLVHAPYTGQRTVHLPRLAAVYSLFERRLVTQGSSTFRAFMRGRSTNFFLWGEIDNIAISLGTTSDELRQQHAAWKAERDGNQQRTRHQRDQSFGDSEREGEYASSEGSADSDNESDDGASEIEMPQITKSPEPPTVSNLVESGLIAGDIDSAESDFDYDNADDAAATPESTPVKSEGMSPSRRRRWNRKRNMQAARGATPPAISMEDLLSDLPPRKQLPPKSDSE